MKPKTKILIADDHPLLRESLYQVLSNQRDMEVVAEAGDGEEAVNLVSQLKPDVTVMDIMMPKLNGIEASKQIKKVAPNTAILILTAYDNDNYVLGLLEAGAAGYLLKSARGQDLVEAVRAIQAGESVLHPSIIEKLIKRAMDKSVGTVEAKVAGLLSDRELKILKVLASGMSNKQIAEKLSINLRTVKAHMSNIFTKMNVASRSEALIKALRLGLLTLEDIEEKGNSEG